MNEKNIYLKSLIKNIRENDVNSLKEVIKLFEKYMRMLSKGKGTYIYDELLDELLILILIINLEKENLFGYIKVCLKNYYIKLIKGVSSGKCGFHTLRAFSQLIPRVCRLFRYSKVYIVLSILVHLN